MKHLAALALGLAAFGARAEAPDLKTYTCSAYTRFVLSNMASPDQRAQMAVAMQMSWIVGYESAQHQVTTMDGERLGQMVHDIGTRCQASPDTLVVTQADESWAHPQPLKLVAPPPSSPVPPQSAAPAPAPKP